MKKKKKTRVLHTEVATLLCKGDVAAVKVRQLAGLKACGVKKVIVRIVGVIE